MREHSEEEKYMQARFDAWGEFKKEEIFTEVNKKSIMHLFYVFSVGWNAAEKYYSAKSEEEIGKAMQG